MDSSAHNCACWEYYAGYAAETLFQRLKLKRVGA